MQQVKHDIFKGVLREIDFRPADTPDVEDMAAGNFERGSVRGRVEILLWAGMTAHDPRQLFGEIDA